MSKYSEELKLKIVKEHEETHIGATLLQKKYGIHHSQIKQWIAQYELTGSLSSAVTLEQGFDVSLKTVKNLKIKSTNKDFVKNATEQIDSVWMGSYCKSCKRKAFCSDPIV